MAGASFRVDFLTFPSAHSQFLAKAESLFSEAQLLAASPLQAPVRQSIEKFRQAGIVWAATGDREGQILALAGESQAWLDLSQGASSVLALDKARILSARMPFFHGWLEGRRAQIYLDRMNSKQAATYAGEARHAGEDLNDPWLTAASLAELAESEYLVRAPSEHNDAREAIRLSRQVHAVLPLARALRCNAWIEQDAGRITRALSLLHEAEDLYQYGDDSRDAAMGMSDMANNQELSGNPYTALLRHTALLPLIRRSGKLTYLEYLYGLIANDYQALNKVPDAIIFATRGLQIAQKVALPSDESGDSIERSQLCDLQLSVGRLHQALDNCRKALDTVEQIHDPKRIAIASWRLGKVQRALGRSSEAIASFRFAIDMSQSVGDVWTQPRALIDWGDTLEHLGQDAEARRLFRKALQISQASEDPSATIEARYRIARSEFRAGETQQAVDGLQNLLADIEAQRRRVTDPDLQASFFAQMHKCHELLIELLMREVKRDPGSADEALDVSESGRARTLLDVLSSREISAASPHLARTSDALGDLHLAVDRSYDRRLRLMLEGGSKSDLNANAAALTQAIDALERQEDEQRGAPPSSVAPEKVFRSRDFAAASQQLHSTQIGRAHV